MDRLTTEMIQATWSVCHLSILQPPKLCCIHPELWKSSKCVVCTWEGWVGGVQARGKLYRSRRQSTKANAPPPDIFRGIYSHAYSSLLFWEFMHIHYFTWLKYPPKPTVSFRVQIWLVWSSADGASYSTTRPGWLSVFVLLFPHSACLCASVCLRGTTTGDTQGDRNAHFCVIWLGSPPAWHSPFLVLSHVLKCAQTRYTIIAHLPPSCLFLARVAQFIQVRSQFKCGQKQYANCKLQNNKAKICDKAAIHVLYGAAGTPWPTGPVVSEDPNRWNPSHLSS